MTSDEPLLFAPEKKSVTSPPSDVREWRILVADDDDDVHAATELALRHVSILGRPIVLDHARSGAEVLSRMGSVGDEYYATILLDVVMETSDAGLATVSALREHLGILATRIVLRTGQPGHAPDVEAVSNYEIDDYRTKGELTRNRLITTLTASVRAFRQVVALNDHRRGLQKVIGAAGGLLEVRGMRAFAEGALEQVAALMDLPPDGIVCTEVTRADASDQDELLVTGASGRFASTMGHSLAKLPDEVRGYIERCIAAQVHTFDEAHTVLYLGQGKKPRAVYIATGQPLNARNTQLVSVLATNLSAGLQNAALFSELDFAANYCALTSLPNRYRFTRLLAEQRLLDPRGSVAVVDLHDFSSISKGLGYDVASSLLKEVGKALASRFRPLGCIVARLESDVFAIAGPELVVTPEAINACFQAPYTVDVHSIHVEAAIGIDCFDAASALDKTEVITRAEIALDEAKAQPQPPWRTYSAAMGERLRGDIALINDMREAFQKESFEVWYQPQVGASHERGLGAEALLRWRLPSGAFVSPMRFIPLA